MDTISIWNEINMVKKVYLALDIEKTGSKNLQHPICSIGWCLGLEDGTVLEKNRINLKVKWPIKMADSLDYGDFEPRCWDEFWSKHPSALVELITRDAVGMTTGMFQFSALLDRLEEQYPSPEYKLTFLSDNASFDIAALDVNLERYVNRIPLRYSKTCKYRAIEAPDDMLDVFPSHVVKKLVAQKIDPYVSHDHDPANDAEHIYRQYLLMQHLKTKLSTIVDEVWLN